MSDTEHTEGLDTQPTADTLFLEDLVAQAWAGHVRVPHFQRDFRWNSQDVIRLFDSIVRGYPVGSLLLWMHRSPAERITLGALDIDAPQRDNALWVVDGQQRITSLANTLHSEGNQHQPFNVHYDLRKGEFTVAPKMTEAHVVPLSVLFDLEKLLDWFSGPGKAAAEHLTSAGRIAKKLRAYKVPAYLVRQDNEAVLRDMFDRMNNFGKRLKRAEIFSALFPGPVDSTGKTLSITRIAEHVASRTGFGTLDDDTVLRSLLARRGPDITRELHNEFDDSRRRTPPEFPKENESRAYTETEKALVRAVEFIQETAGVPHLSLLAYRSLVIVFARFFAHFPEPEARNQRLLRRLYWRIAVSGPTVFKGSFTQMGKALAGMIKPGDEHGSVKQLIRSMDEAQPIIPDTARFRANTAGTKILICSWWALAPRSPLTGIPYDLQDLSGLLADESSPNSAVPTLFRGLPPEHQNLAANRVFLPSGTEPVEDALARLAAAPLSPAGETGMKESEWVTTLASHCMTTQSAGLLAAGDTAGFLSTRQKLISAHLQEFLGRMAEWNYEDTPALGSLDFDDDEPEEHTRGVA